MNPNLAASTTPHARKQSMTSTLLNYYEAIEKASADMLEAARTGDWDEVCRLEGACAVVIARLRRLKVTHPLQEHEQPERLRILPRLLVRQRPEHFLSPPLRG